MYLLNNTRWRIALWLAAALLLAQAGYLSADQTLTLIKGGQSTDLQRKEVESLGLYSITMQHPEGPQGTFSGVWLDALLQKQGLDKANRVRFIAEDGYTTFLTPEERSKKRYLLVTRLDGEPVTQENLGPYMLIVPDDAKAAQNGTASITRWIWAVRKIQAR